MNGSFFCTFSWEITKNKKIPFLITKTDQSSKIISLLKRLAVDYKIYNESTLTFEVKSLWKDLQPQVHFSLAFYVQKLKKHKIHFLVTNSGQKLNLMSFSDPRPKICVFFICSFFFWWIFFLAGSHGFRGLFGAFCVACMGKFLTIDDECVEIVECSLISNSLTITIFLLSSRYKLCFDEKCRRRIW